MRRATAIALFLFSGASAQQRVLHFTRTSGFDHGTRAVSYTMFQDIAAELDLIVDDDNTGDAFSDAQTLAEYAVIVFANTTGDAILSADQRSNFEAWVANGGRVLGIHSATDTYRHSTANGNNTGAWDYYAELIGASVQADPHHVSGTPEYAMEHIGVHESTANLPDPWMKNEEYYYWEGGYFGADNVEVLRVEETVGPNGQVNSYDAPRPMSWYRELPGGSRVFYTALGHATENYTSDALFRAHIQDALAWLLDATSAVEEQSASEFFIRQGADQIEIGPLSQGAMVELLDVTGRIVRAQCAEHTTVVFETSALRTGVYLIRMGTIAERFCVVH